MRIINSLALRLFLSASVWILLTLFSGGLLLSDIFKESSEKAFEDKLNLFITCFFDVKKRNNKTAGVKKKERQKYIVHTSWFSNNLNNAPPVLKNRPPSDTNKKPGIL